MMRMVMDERWMSLVGWMEVVEEKGLEVEERAIFQEADPGGSRNHNHTIKSTQGKNARAKSAKQNAGKQHP